MNKRISLNVCVIFLAVGIAACSTEVAVNPKGGPIATVKPNWFTGGVTMAADVKGDIPRAFHAASLTLENLHYYRTAEGTDQTSILARGPMDVYVEINLSPTKDAGLTNVAVYLNSGKTPDAQAIFSGINDTLATMPEGPVTAIPAPATRGARRGGPGS